MVQLPRWHSWSPFRYPQGVSLLHSTCFFAAITTADVAAAALNFVAPVVWLTASLPCSTVKCVHVVDFGVPVTTSTLDNLEHIHACRFVFTEDLKLKVINYEGVQVCFLCVCFSGWGVLYNTSGLLVWGERLLVRTPLSVKGNAARGVDLRACRIIHALVFVSCVVPTAWAAPVNAFCRLV